MRMTHSLHYTKIIQNCETHSNTFRHNFLSFHFVVGIEKIKQKTCVQFDMKHFRHCYLWKSNVSNLKFWKSSPKSNGCSRFWNNCNLEMNILSLSPIQSLILIVWTRFILVIHSYRFCKHLGVSLDFFLLNFWKTLCRRFTQLKHRCSLTQNTVPNIQRTWWSNCHRNPRSHTVCPA